MQRYDLERSDCESMADDMMPDKDGDYVLWEDAKREIARVTKERDELLKTALEHVHEYWHMSREQRTEEFWIYREEMRPHYEALMEQATKLIAQAGGK